MGLVFSGIFGFLGVAIGAFGAHALRDRLSGVELEIFKTGSQYHLVHAVALGLCAGLALWGRRSGLLGPEALTALDRAQIFFGIGIILFSFSLYGLAVTQIKGLGAITP